MNKKIISITLENYRAYYGKYDSLYLPDGKNLLIYGENGSGKSSLYKALNNYFASSININLPFIKNRHSIGESGEVRISFADFDTSTSKLIGGTEVEYIFSDINSNNHQTFIRDASLVRGFLDYTDLLKVYFHTEDPPNLFDLIVLNLLSEHIPISSGGNFRFKQRWLQLQEDLITNAYTRQSVCHQNALKQLPIYEVHLSHTLDQIFTELNRLLVTYFPDLNIQLRYHLQPLTFNYHRLKSEWYTTKDLKLEVIKDGIPIIGSYSDVLNEARLSAISICLYLSSLLRNPTNVDFRILYLDDVFIGLDAGNRLPILNIIKNEFPNHQIFISTYDRHWFELSNRYFEADNELKWSTLEIYVGKDSIGDIEITKPILLKGSSNYAKAIYYLHHRIKPDYPAAANYFRKALEELIQKYLPKYELTDNQNIQLPDHKLTVLLKKTKNFLGKTNNSYTELNKIIGLLHTLLHPLSHHEINSPIYKGELVVLETAFSKLNKQLESLNTQNNYRCILEPNVKVKLTFIVDIATGYYCYYEIVLKETLILLHIPLTPVTISNSACRVDKLYGVQNGTPLKGGFSPKKDNPIFNFTSLENAVRQIYIHLTEVENLVFSLPPDYTTMFEYYNGTSWQSLSGKLIW